MLQKKPRKLLLGEGGDGLCLVVLHVEDGVELGDLEQVMDLLGQVQQLSSPPWLRTEVKALTNSPMPELSI